MGVEEYGSRGVWESRSMGVEECEGRGVWESRSMGVEEYDIMQGTKSLSLLSRGSAEATIKLFQVNPNHHRASVRADVGHCC